MLWGGFIITMKLSAVVAALALPLALLTATLSIAPSRGVRVLASTWVDLFRSVPSLALLIFLYFGIGSTAVSPFWLAAIGLTVIESAYLSEIYRAALEAIGMPQWEAGYSLGFGWLGILRLIIMPEAAVSAIPGTVNTLTLIIKDTSLASLVAVNEVTLRATELSSETFRPLPVFLLLGLFYIALILPLTVLGASLERYLAHRFRVTSRSDYRELLRVGRTPLGNRFLAHLGMQRP